MTRRNDGTLRGLGGVLLGYVAMVGTILTGVTILAKTMPADDLFEPGSFATRDFVIGFSLVLTAFAALIGGFVCTLVAGSRRPAYVLAGIVAAFGLATILFAVTAAKPDPKPRTGDESPEVQQEQMAVAKPRLSQIAEPLLAVAGIVMGSRWSRASTRL